MKLCNKGLHEMTPENTYVSPKGRSWCRQCTKDRQRRQHLRNDMGVTALRAGAHHADAVNAEQDKWDEMFARRPPIIDWVRKGPVWVAASVYDPHADGGHNREKTKCKLGHPFDDANTLIYADGKRQCRICKNKSQRAVPVTCDRGHLFDTVNTIVTSDGDFECRACTAPRDTPLLSAARTDI